MTQIGKLSLFSSFNNLPQNRFQRNAIGCQEFPEQSSSNWITRSQTLDYHCRFRINQLSQGQQSIPLTEPHENQLKEDSVYSNTDGKTIKMNKQQIIRKANSAIRELSVQNRFKSKDKIKAEESCFRFKLKLTSLLRKFDLTEYEATKLTELESEQFLQSFVSKMNKYHKIQQSLTNALKNKNNALCLTLKIKNQQISAIRAKLIQKQRQIATNSMKYTIQLKENRRLLTQKEEQIKNIKQKMIQKQNKSHQERKLMQTKINSVLLQSVSQNNKIAQLSSQLQHKQQQNNKLQIRLSFLQISLKQQQKQIVSLKTKLIQCQDSINEQNQLKLINLLQVDLNQAHKITKNDEFSAQKMQDIIEQWKNCMYQTVNQYEQLVENLREDLRVKEQKIYSYYTLMKISL